MRFPRERSEAKPRFGLPDRENSNNCASAECFARPCDLNLKIRITYVLTEKEFAMLRLSVRRYFSALVVFATAAAIASPIFAADDIWTTNFAAAKEKAKKEKKLLLVNFTGSDWCGWCKKLKAEVFDQEEFINEAPKDFVLVELDYPNSKKLPDELVKQNQTIKEKYKIVGFPTIMILTPEERLVAKTGYAKGGPTRYVVQLLDFVGTYRNIEELTPKLAGLKGIERAKLLDQIVDLYDKLQNESDEVVAYSNEIISLDADNKAGLKIKHQVKSLLAVAEKQRAKRDLAGALNTFDSLIALDGISPEQKQKAYAGKSNVCMMQKDFVNVVENMKKAIAAAPDNPQASRIAVMLKTLEAKAEAQKTLTKIFDELETAKGLDRAKVLDRIIDAKRDFFGSVNGVPAVNPGGTLGHQILMNSMYDDEEVENIAKWSKEIATLDADGKAGLKRKYEYRSAIAEAELAFREKDYDRVVELLDQGLELKDLSKDEKQGLLFLKSDINIMRKDIAASLDYCKKAIAVSDETPLAKFLENRAKQLEMVLSSMKEKNIDPKTGEKTDGKNTETQG